MLDVIELFSDRSTVDELGLGNLCPNPFASKSIATRLNLEKLEKQKLSSKSTSQRRSATFRLDSGGAEKVTVVAKEKGSDGKNGKGEEEEKHIDYR